MNDEQTRQLLEDAVSDVETRGGLDEIRSRTAASRPRRSWMWGASGAAAAVAATVAAVAVVTGLPGATSSGPAADGGPDVAPRTVPLYFVGGTGAGPRLFVEHREVGGGKDPLEWSLGNVVHDVADDPDYTSAWPSGAAVDGARFADGVLTVDLSGPVGRRPAGTSSADAELALQQVVRTAEGVVGTPVPVTFLLDGEPTTTVLGVATDRPVPAAADDATLAPVSIAAPVEGARVTSPFTVTGEASAFEANVQWELSEGGTVVKRGFATADECCTLSPYSFSVEAPPGEYTLVVHDEDVSDGEGDPPSQDTKKVTVR